MIHGASATADQGTSLLVAAAIVTAGLWTLLLLGKGIRRLVRRVRR